MTVLSDLTAVRDFHNNWLSFRQQASFIAERLRRSAYRAIFLCMNYDQLVSFVQGHFTDGLVLVIGSGLSAAEGIPGMTDLAAHLEKASAALKGDDAARWQEIALVIKSGEGLEAALLKHAPTDTLEAWIIAETCSFLLPHERRVFSDVFSGKATLRLTDFLRKTLKPSSGLPILTPNYDRLIELACEMAGFHVDTTAVGIYAGVFEPKRSLMAACRGLVQSRKTPALDFFPRAVVLKPHGSFDWYRNNESVVRCSADLNADRAVITPGINKYRAGYNEPFDKHRELANQHIDRAARLMVVGYGFNDDHLQTHLVKRINDGTPTLILTRTPGAKALELATKSPNCICISKANSDDAIRVIHKHDDFEHKGHALWDLRVLTQELLP